VNEAIEHDVAVSLFEATPKQIGLVAPVKSEGKFIDVERQIIARQVME